jgi:hypothetical protein
MQKHDYMISRLATDDYQRLMALRVNLPGDQLRDYCASNRGTAFVVRYGDEVVGYLLAYTNGKKGVCTDIVVYAPHSKKKISQMLVRALFASTTNRIVQWELPKAAYRAADARVGQPSEAWQAMEAVG